ncbi:MAG: carbohydrate binding family 9 domain-containing protein [Acidobacteria bacterium]|nr:carbohydrate binding family 9 domain-containing protein [Acidobacteriota bacterium]
MIFRCLGATLLLALAAAPQKNTNHNHRKARAFRMVKPPTMDGVMEETEWGAIEPAAGLIQQEPKEGELESERTEVRFGFDDRNLYIGIICFDSQPDNIVVTQNRRDAVLTDTDSIQILLDTFHDRQNAFVFGTSPTGIEHDGQISKAGQGRGGVGQPARAGGQGTTGGGAQRGGASAYNLNWDGVWRVRSRITQRGWESEMVIPLQTLRYLPGRNRTWGLNITRNVRRKNEQTFWNPVGRGFFFTQVDLAGELEGLELKNQHDLQLIPYAVGGFKQDYQNSNPSEGAHTGGLDVKYTLTPSLAVDGTLNTDFAQVEVDDEQINLTRFDLFFPEKRPFFLENSGYFEFGTSREIEVFFSRRIGIDESGAPVPILAGARISGKAGRYEVGMLNMQTRSVAGVTPMNNFTVARVSRELGNRSSIGGIFTNKQAVDAFPGWSKPLHNRAYGADANFGIGRNTNVFNYFAKTDTPGRPGGDTAFSSSMTFDNEHHRVDAGYWDVGENFNPEVGFLRRAGYRKPTVGYRYTHYPASRRVRQIFPHFQWNRWYTRSTNEKESGFEHYHLDTRWNDGSQLGIAHNRNYERLDKPFVVFPGIIIPPGRYPYNEVVVNYGTDPTARFFTQGNASAGGFYSGTIRTVNFNGGYRKSSNVTWTGGWAHNWIHLPTGDFDTDLIGLRFNWTFTPKRYVQVFTQYNSRAEQVGVNARLALLSTSSTGLFVVYNSKAATYDFIDPHDIQRRTMSRALYIKFNYLFDF